MRPEAKTNTLMKPSRGVDAAASELHLCQFSYADNPKRKTAARPDFCLGYTLDEGRKLNFLPIDYTRWQFPKVNSSFGVTHLIPTFSEQRKKDGVSKAPTKPDLQTEEGRLN